MRKGLIIVSLLIIVMTIVTNLFLPNFISFTLHSYLKNTMQAHNINGEIEVHPSFMIAAGDIDKIVYTADTAVIGNTEVHNLSLVGENIQLDMPSLVKKQFKINSAKNIKISCTIDNKSLEKLLARRISKVQDVHVNIMPKFVMVKAAIPLLGNKISAEMRGHLYTKGGNIYFKIAELDVENDFLGKISLNKMENVLLVDRNKLPFDAKIDSVVQKENEIAIVANAHKE
ncbi:hypothetical protein [Pectinatus sottacetonis]|uniref:hypothetical protein n=1 Tax=Pectinatus sottacetonis TaxID=1002795 RepID=UPI0018C5E65A|nr:hypothetical protein [Pectinatus sottacetonis]